MPVLADNETETFKATGSGFAFSAVNVKNLGASEYTLVGLACDVSSSVYDFANDIEGCLKSVLEGCQKSPRVDNLLVRLITFNSRVTENHGFKPLTDCHLGNYNGAIKPGGATALYDATINLVDSLATYGKTLIDNDYSANGIVVILTDGLDCASTLTTKAVKEAVARARKAESLESIVTILIGINVTDPSVGTALKAFQTEAGIDQYIEVQDASPKTFAKVAGFVSKSVSSQSQSLGTGVASQPITF